MSRPVSDCLLGPHFTSYQILSIFPALKGNTNLNQKIGCAAANPRLLRGKPLYYSTIGLMMGNIYLTSEINIILAKGNIIVAMRRKPECNETVTKCKVKRFHSC